MDIRNVIIETFETGATGSVIISAGNTRVLCTASLSTDLPGWLAAKEPPSGWISAEYNMLPGSTSPRKKRGTDGRSTEIQRLIGRSLRAMVELTSIPGLSIICDCEVLQADGGTRTAAISGASVSLMLALGTALDQGKLAAPPTDRLPIELVTAISAGVVDGKCVVDLDYDRDSRADVDLNAVQNQKKECYDPSLVHGCCRNARARWPRCFATCRPTAACLAGSRNFSKSRCGWR